jgi:hypothetical protein
MPKRTPDPAPESPRSSLVLYVTEDGRSRIECCFEGETIWLSQALMAELFQTTPQNVTMHLRALYAEGEINEAATCKDLLQVRAEGTREVTRTVRHYRLEAILAVGYRVRSPRGTQFRQWATARLSEFLRKGFTLDDERLKNPPGPGVPDHFDDLLERIRDIRASERRMRSSAKVPNAKKARRLAERGSRRRAGVSSRIVRRPARRGCANTSLTGRTGPR